MQVLCQLSNTASDVHCKVCGQGFLVYWASHEHAARETARALVAETLIQHHTISLNSSVHPTAGFNVPDWSGLTRFSAAEAVETRPARTAVTS
jgi:hypothetical protein